jgi:hypothetical protein
MKDNLIICTRCGSDACYHQKMGADYTVDLCYGCGFTTNSLMVEKSEFLKEQLEVLPELYKDLIFKDSEEKYWIPSSLNIPDKGMIFANGENIKKWTWTAVKAISLSEAEISKFPEGTTHKMDMKNAQHYDERDYIEALDYINMFNTTPE